MHEALPEQIQRQAKAAYRKFQQDPYQAGLQFKQVHEVKPICSARISRDYRAVGIKARTKSCGFGLARTRIMIISYRGRD